MPRKGKNQIIYHGYDLTGVLNGKSSEPPGNFSIAIPGRLLKRKGHSFAVEALKELLRDYPHTTLHFYGEGPFEQHLRNIVKDKALCEKVFFHGYVNNIVQQLRKYDLIVIPSLWEGFGIVFLDAFAAERPVVAFNLPAGNEIILNEYNGLLAVPGDASSLASMIKRVFESFDLGNRLSKNALLKLKTEFSIGQMCSKYLEFYKSFL